MNRKDWSLSLLAPGEKQIATLPLSFERNETILIRCGITLKVTHREIDGIHFFQASAQSEKPMRCYFSLNRENTPSELLSFAGVETAHDIYRQSPHDAGRYHFDMLKQPVPVGACRVDGGYEVALSDAPYYSDNYTTQEFIPDAHRFSITSGDSGRKPGYQGDVDFAPYYHEIGSDKNHVFRFLIFTSCAKSIHRLRMDAFRAIVKCFGNGSSLYHAICFSTNYMHLRRNETGVSHCWVVAGIEYGNAQYVRDSFWQTKVGS